MLAPHYAERALSVAGALIDRARYVQRIEREISVAYDAWNVSLGGGRLEERYNLADALAVATYLNVFVRPDAVGVQSAKREVDGEYVDVTFSPHSFTLLEMHLA